MKITCLIGVLLLWAGLHSLPAQWLNLTRVQVTRPQTELAGPAVAIEYELADPQVNTNAPAYVFLRFSRDGGRHWQALPASFLRGNAHGLVPAPGRKRSVWWGVDQLGLKPDDPLEVRVRALAMIRVPAGQFLMNSIPGGGYDDAQSRVETLELPEFWIARCETTLGMYADYLNEPGRPDAGYTPKMAHPQRCGLVAAGPGQYTVLEGRALYPVNFLSWYDAQAFLDWCDLRLPTEAEWLKALRGGLFLDGDGPRQRPNPLPERPYPWGREAPDADGKHRCNYDGEADGFAFTAPVGSFPEYASPYGVLDLVGNVAEWTLDWYATSYHAGLDGFRIVRGGSWMDPPAGCDALTAPTSLPLKESALMGFRGVRASR